MGKGKVRIVILVENTVGVHKGLRVEHGLSFYVEIDGNSLLFDTGQSSAFMENAKKLRIDLSALKAVCISHGHYDHSGGLRPLLEQGIRSPLWVGQGFFDEKYAKDSSTYEYVGNDFDASDLERWGLPYHVMDSEVKEILPRVYAVSRFNHTFADELVNPRFWVFRDGMFKQDTFNDEFLLVLDTSKGLVVLLGCSHPGVKNMLSTVKERFTGKKIHAVLGGTHMVEATDRSIGESLSYFAGGFADLVGVSHCTGKKASKIFEEGIRGFFPNHTGSMLWIE